MRTATLPLSSSSKSWLLLTRLSMITGSPMRQSPRYRAMSTRQHRAHYRQHGRGNSRLPGPAPAVGAPDEVVEQPRDIMRRTDTGSLIVVSAFGTLARDVAVANPGTLRASRYCRVNQTIGSST